MPVDSLCTGLTALAADGVGLERVCRSVQEIVLMPDNCVSGHGHNSHQGVGGRGHIGDEARRRQTLFHLPAAPRVVP